MERIIAILASALLSICTLSAQSTSTGTSPMWLRNSCISPDGQTVVFCYKSDIFTVSVNGGTARQITSNNAYETDPIWTPDGKNIVFSSWREASSDIYIVPAEGGVPRRITDHPYHEKLMGVLPDGSIVFMGSIQTDSSYDGYPSNQIFTVSQEGGRPRLVTSLAMANLSVNKEGLVLYEDNKGYEDPLRKHHTSSVTRDIWLFTPAAGSSKSFNVDGKGTFTKLSSYAGEDRNPVFAADGRTYYFTSEYAGNFNIFRSDISSPGKYEQITFLKRHPVRNISVSSEGTVLFSYDGELYTISDRNGKVTEPKKISINIVADQYVPEKLKTAVSNVYDFAIAPGGKEMAVISRGDVYVTAIDATPATRITNTPEAERGLSFSKDGRTLYYASERNGHWGIYRTTLSEKDDNLFCLSYKFKEELVTDPSQTCFQPSVSPDGKWLAFLRDRTELVIKDTKSGKEKSLFKDINYSYKDGDQSFSWSPDSKYILTGWDADGGWNNSDVAMVDIESGKITNLTQSGYSDGNFKWALGGKAMTWESDRAGYRSHGSWGAETDVYLMFFDNKTMTEFNKDKETLDIEKFVKDAARTDVKDIKKEEKKEARDSAKVEKEAKKEGLDLTYLEDRTIRLTRTSGVMGDHFLTPDGEKLYYIVRLERGMDLCVLETRSKSVKVLEKGMLSSKIYPSPDGKDFYMLSMFGVVKYDGKSGARRSISFRSEFEYDPVAEREYIFEHIWKQVEEKFYDPDIHGTDWKGLHDDYKKFLPHINNPFVFQDLLSEMLGELNGSHTGARYRPNANLNIASFGVIYDNSWEGDGLKIKEVLPSGVMAIQHPEIKEGAVIEAIEGNPIKAGESWYKYLTNKDGKRVRLSISSDGKKAVDVYVVAAKQTDESVLLYKRWVRQREEMVEKLSGGRVGYVHVKSMDSDSYRNVYSKLLGKYRTCEAVIVDTRHNGGGWLHDDLATLLNGKRYVDYQPRGQYVGSDPYNKWTKPSCVIIGEDNYSDASGFPYVYKTLGIGKLIGAPVPGTMTAVWWETQVDGSIVFGIPEVGTVGLKEGRYLENMQIEPDILVYNDPASTLNGEDKQLEAAVAQMLKEIEKK